ncbi:MAG: T9SS type A sorting domain-containing protein [Saprospiraceae bacterium]|nr:T9SS type A sorting domain-containing protein [Saprospiraceae bacterium]
MNANGIVEIPVTSSNFEQIASYQMGLSFDVNKLAFIDVVPSSNPALAKLAVGATEVENGVLRLSWFDLRGEGVSVNSDEVLFTLRFRVLHSIENLSNTLEVNSRFIRAEAYTNEATPMDVVLTIQGSAILNPGNESAISYKLYQNVPNPFAQQAFIGFDLPSDMQADLIIFDQLGKMVRKYSGNFMRGYNRIEVPKQSLADGVYYYTLRTADFSDTKSMVIIE